MNLWYNACSANSGRSILAAVPVLYSYIILLYTKEKEQYNQIYMFYIISSFFLYKKEKEQFNQIYMVARIVASRQLTAGL